MLERQRTHSAFKWTYQDYLIFSGDKRYEIIEGERYVVPSPNTRHQIISRKLEEILGKVGKGTWERGRSALKNLINQSYFL